MHSVVYALQKGLEGILGKNKLREHSIPERGQYFPGDLILSYISAFYHSCIALAKLSNKMVKAQRVNEISFQKLF